LELNRRLTDAETFHCLFILMHFGQVTNVLEKLQKYADQLKLWANVVVEKMKEGTAMEETKEEIAKSDSAICKLNDYIKTNLIMNRGYVSQVIQGFVEYFNYKERQR